MHRPLPCEAGLLHVAKQATEKTDKVCTDKGVSDKVCTDKGVWWVGSSRQSSLRHVQRTD